MTKKHRTGLQSKISHIFAGVPIPKKSRPRSEPEKPEPEQDVSELKLSQEEEPQIEETVTQESTEEQPVTSQLPDDEPLVVESVDEQSTEIEDESEKDIAAEEKIQEPAIDEPIVEEPVLEIQDEASPVQEPVIEQQSELKETDEKQVIPIPVPKEPEIAEPIVEESAVEIPVNVPPVKEPVIEKPSAPMGSKFDVTEVEEPVETQKKPYLSRTLKADVAQARTMQVTRKAPKRLKSKRITKKPATSPTRQKTMIALVIVLSIVLVMLLVKPFSRFSQSTSGNTGAATNGSQVSAVRNFQDIKIDWPEPPVYNSEILRDPMELGQATKESKQLIVKGISSVAGKPLATIGKDQYKVGDEVIPGVIIKEITEKYVEFERDGETWTQNVGE